MSGPISEITYLTGDDMDVYMGQKDRIESKIREVFPSVPADFDLRPVRVYRAEACGTIYYFRVALPDNKYAKVSFLVGGAYWGPPGPDGKPPSPQPPTIRVDENAISNPDEKDD